MPDIKVVLWDLDATLLDFDIPERNAIKKCFKDFNLGICPQKFLDAYHTVNIEWWERMERGEYTKAEIIVGRFTDMLSRFGYDASIAKEFNDDYMNRLGDTVCPVRHAVETVSALKQKGILQVVATNGILATQKKKIANSGLDKVMDGIYISDAIGADKPSIKFFDKVLSDFPGYEKNQIMIVGDSLSSDMQGGNNAGIVCCWFNEKHLENTKRNLRIDYEIDDVARVLDIVFRNSLK